MLLLKAFKVHRPLANKAYLARFSNSPSVPSDTTIFNKIVDYFSVDQTDGKIQCGDYSLIASQGGSSKRSFVDVSKLGVSSTDNPIALNSKVWLRGRLSAVRAKGNACFLVVRSGSFYTIQCCHFKNKEQPEISKELIKYASAIATESIIDVYGTIVSADVKSCTQNNVELQIEKIFTVSRAPVQLPFLLQDAGRTQKEIDDSQSTERPFPNVPQDLRLNNRWLDLRVPSNNAIMRIKSGVSLLFREALHNRGFTEIQSPKLIAGESEGGSDVFRTNYFGQTATLAQSPQLYKQMAISADLGRVYEIGPVFRAENSKTRRHLCEFIGLDLEMEIYDNYNELLIIIHGLFQHIFNGLEERYSKELSIIREQYPSEKVRFTSQPLVIHWPEGIQLLRDAGVEINEWEDLSTADEQKLGEIISEKYNTDFYILDQYPSAVRPFYTMPNALDPRYSNSYDIFIRGQEICSGAQRCHVPEMLIERIKEKNMSLDSLSSYIDSFKHAVSPHAGAGIGLERVVFLYLGLDNIRKASMFPRDPTRITP